MQNVLHNAKFILKTGKLIIGKYTGELLVRKGQNYIRRTALKTNSMSEI